MAYCIGFFAVYAMDGKYNKSSLCGLLRAGQEGGDSLYAVLTYRKIFTDSNMINALRMSMPVSNEMRAIV